jgi:hypothetical protein
MYQPEIFTDLCHVGVPEKMIDRRLADLQPVVQQVGQLIVQRVVQPAA